ncbi:MAG TPA: hypothetical protein VM470_01165 [Acidimicrobiia bacterium]|nr:hypothetical protein [Acidimicrobiia bacterium]
MGNNVSRMGNKRTQLLAALAAVAVVVVGVVALGGLTGSDPTTPTVSSTLPAPTTRTSSTSTSAAPTTTVSEPATGLPLEEPVPLRVYSFGANGDGMATLDLEAGTSTVIAPEDSLIRGVDGAVVTPSRSLIVWAGGVVYVMGGDNGFPDREILPTNAGPHLRDMRVVPAPDGETVWLIQPGPDSPTLIELVGLADGARLITAESDPGLVPIGATSDGVIFNTDTGQVVLFTYSGVIRPIGEGRALAASADTVVWLDCAQPACGDLLVAHPAEPTQFRVISKPGEGEWFPVGGSVIPNSTMPFETISPDGSRLLVGTGQDFDVNGVPATAQLLSIDLASGANRPLAAFNRYQPRATWSSDSEWVVSFEGDLLNLHDYFRPGSVTPLQDVIPEGFRPLAAG